MIFIDAREGLSGDMLLSAMIGLLDHVDRDAFLGRLENAAKGERVTFELLDVEDAGDIGLSMAYSRREPDSPETGISEALDRLERIDEALGGSGGISRRILGLVFEAESEAHGLPEDEVHLHEIGRPQAMLNICGIGSAAKMLEGRGAEGFMCSTISTGGGVVTISHGAFRVPPPATAILLRGLRHVSGDSPGERATPTGIAAVRAIIGSQSDDIPAAFRRRSVGFGTRRFAGRLGRTVLTWP
jgi:uncharacterized protein (DUF111 family)